MREINVLVVKTLRLVRLSAIAFIGKDSRWIVVWQLLIGQKICANPMRNSRALVSTIQVLLATFYKFERICNHT